MTFQEVFSQVMRGVTSRRKGESPQLISQVQGQALLILHTQRPANQNGPTDLRNGDESFSRIR